MLYMQSHHDVRAEMHPEMWIDTRKNFVHLVPEIRGMLNLIG